MLEIMSRAKVLRVNTGPEEGNKSEPSQKLKYVNYNLDPYRKHNIEMKLDLLS